MQSRARTVASTTLLTAQTESWRDYLELCKLRVVALIVFTAVVGMFLATPGWVPFEALFLGSVGIALAASAAAAVNHVLDQRLDAIMARTMRRPLPSGRVETSAALLFAAALCVLSMVLLTVFVNALTACLTFLSLVGYSAIYTGFLKRATPQNIVIGGAAGAMPPVLGWTAVTGQVEPHALLLFLIVFAWTPPHFWSLAIHRRQDYARAGLPMLPVTHGVDFTCLQILLYTVILFIASLLPFLTHMSGVLYLSVAIVLGVGFLGHAIAMWVTDDSRLPIRTFGYSIYYLAGLFTALLADHYLVG